MPGPRRNGGFRAPPFPYHHLKTDLFTVEQMAEKMRDYQGHIIDDEDYELRGYFPDKDRVPRSILFGGKKVYLKAYEVSWRDFDLITEGYTETERVKTRINYLKYSPLDYWKKCHRSIKERAEQEGRTCESIIYKETHGAGILRPSWMISLLRLLHPDGFSDKSILHPSAGWGPILALAAAFGMDYTGVDPNLALKPGLEQMIKDIGDASKQEVIYQPFEDVILTKMHDIVIWSPPYFNFERYSTDKTQSIVRYPKFEGWMNNFLLPSTVKAWNQLKVGGYMVIHLSDSKMYSMCDRVNDTIEKCGNGKYLGVIAVASECPKWRPLWIWEKMAEVQVQGPTPAPVDFGPM